MRFYLFFVLVLFFSVASVSAQFNYPPLSPVGEIKQQIGYTNLSVKYGRPSVRERKIFGGLVPWNKMWGTGAGSPTTIILDTDVVINGKMAKAGTYHLTTIPNPLEWTIILNSSNKVYTNPGFWESPDVVHFKVPVAKSGRFYESFTISTDIIPGNARIYLNWADTQVSFLLETDADERVSNYITNDLPTSTDADAFSKAANYYYFQNKCLSEGLSLAQHSVTMDPSYVWYRKVIVNIGLRLNDFELIKQTAKDAMSYYAKHPTDDQSIMDYWKKISSAKTIGDLR